MTKTQKTEQAELAAAPPARPAGPPCSTSSDEELSAALRRSPSRLVEAQTGATALYASVNALPLGPTLTVRDVWADATQRTRAAIPPRNAGSMVTAEQRNNAALIQYRVALEASEFFASIMALGYDDLRAIRHSHEARIATTPEARAVLRRSPALARWLEAHDAAVEADAANKRATEKKAVADAPANLLQGLRARGVQILLGDDGSLCAAHGTDLRHVLATELDALREWKAPIVAILRREAEAAPIKPLILA